MAKQGESKLQRRIREALEIEFPTSYWFKHHGGPFSRAGMPDLIGCVSGRYVALEVKRPVGSASRVQRSTIARLKRAGALTGIVKSPAEAIDFVRRYIDAD